MFLKHRKQHIAVARKRVTYTLSPSLLSTKAYVWDTQLASI